MRDPYIGVTGFMERKEVDAVLQAFERLRGEPHKLMVGVLASQKTLRGEKNKWPNRYPNSYRIAELFPSHRLAVNLVHYSTDDPATLGEQICELVGLGGRWMDGFQLNICWPDLAQPEEIRGMRVVLQLGRRAMEEEGFDPLRIVRRALSYDEAVPDRLVTDVLLDSSGGKGVPLDLAFVRECIKAFQKDFPEIGLGVAGGLDAEGIRDIADFLREHPRLSIDAEGRLRGPEDKLHWTASIDYVKAAYQAFFPGTDLPPPGWPRYELIVGEGAEKHEEWHPFRSAARLYDRAWTRVQAGRVKDAPELPPRSMTSAEFYALRDAADEYSASK